MITNLEINAYDIATNIVNTKDLDNEIYNKAADFLLEYENLGELIGDDDNPFNPNVNRIIELEESFLKSIGLINE